MSVETTAKDIRRDRDRLIVFEYDADKKQMHFFLKDAESRDSLLKPVEAYLPVVPESLQGFFSVFRYNLKNVKNSINSKSKSSNFHAMSPSHSARVLFYIVIKDNKPYDSENRPDCVHLFCDRN